MSEKIFVPPLKIQGIKTKLVPLIRENVILDKETIWSVSYTHLRAHET